MITLSKIKEVLGITSTNQDVRLQAILDGILEDVEQFIKNITFGTKTIQIKKNIKKIGLLHKNCTSLTSINGIDIAETEYLINENDEIEVKNLSSFLASDFETIEVKYVAGYAEVPNNIILAVANMVGCEFAKKLGQTITSEALGPRSASYESSNPKKDLNKTLALFIPNHLKLW